jgi:hypothetical protein
MPTLNIEGRRVKIDDSFLQMTQDQQNAAVEEIAKSLKGVKPSGSATDGGLSAAITDIPSEIKKAAGTAIDAMARVGDRSSQGSIEGLLTTGRAALAVPELLLSPLTGTARSLVGHPVAEAETAVGGMINPAVAEQRRASGAAYEDAKHSVDMAMAALATRGRPGAAAAAAPPPLPAAGEGQRITQAAERLTDVTGAPVEVPLAIASDSAAMQRAGQAIRNIPIVGDRIPRATDRLVASLEGATRDVADQFGSGSGPNVANRVGRTVQEGAELEARAAADAARRSDEAVTGAWQRDTDAAMQNVASRETATLDAARAAVGDMSPQDMGQALIQRLRTDEVAARANKDALYDRAGRADASVRLDAVQGVRNSVVEALEEAGVVIDPQLTPAANRMLEELQRLSQLNIPNRAQIGRLVPEGTERVGVTVQGIEQARKRLVSVRSAASNDSDRRAARMVMDRFDRWQSDAFENALISGDDEALRAFRQARAANTEWRNRFFNEENDAGRFVNRIVTGEVTPQEVANYIIGSGQVGAKGVASRLLTEITEATGNNPEALQAIRGGIWNKLTQATEGADPKASAKIIRDIVEFLNGSGRDVANRLFTPEQRRLMNTYADTLRRGADARQLIGEVSQATKPGVMEVQAGPLKQLADSVIGKGGKSDEALFRTIDGYAKSGNKADVGTLAKLVQAVPEQDRKDLAGSIIRQLGISPRTGQFSPDVFVSQWQSYTPQAKAVLFGNAGPQRQAIDDIAMISDRLKQIGQKFGNPSGTAQHVNAYALATGLVASPLATIGSAIGGSLTAKLLAAPASASSLAKWSNAYQALLTKPSPQSLGLFHAASKNLANNAQTLGIKLSSDTLMRLLQGPAAGGAQEQDQMPGPPRQ